MEGLAECILLFSCVKAADGLSVREGILCTNTPHPPTHQTGDILNIRYKHIAHLVHGGQVHLI